MIKKQSTYQKHKIFFKKWTRTSWAVFASLKVVVHNCCTKISSFKDSLMKQQGANKSELLNMSTDINLILGLQSEDIEVPWQEELLLNYSAPRVISATTMTIKKKKTFSLYHYISLSIHSNVLMGIFYTSII